MSPRTTAGTGGGGGRTAVTALLVVVILVAMLLIVRANPSPNAFDPRSGDADGARGLVLLLEDLGVTVDISREPPPTNDGARVLVLDDRLSTGQRQDLLEWVDAGGLAVVADPASSLHGGPGIDGGSVRVSGETPDSGLGEVFDPAFLEANISTGDCTIEALKGLRGIFVRDGLLFPVASGDARCLTDSDSVVGEDGEPADGSASGEDGLRAFAVRYTAGTGSVVGLGDNHLFTNALLRYADNSGLAAALLAPVPGGRVVILVGDEASRTPDDIGSGDDTLGDLVRPGVWMALVQLAIAFVVFAAARGIRTGRAVVEPTPVPLAGSELVRATGTLMQRAGHHQRAGWVLRGALYRQLCRLVRLPLVTSIADLDAAVVGQFPDAVQPGVIAAVLDAECFDAGQLMALSGRIHDMRVAVGIAVGADAARDVAGRSTEAIVGTEAFDDVLPGNGRDTHETGVPR